MNRESRRCEWGGCPTAAAVTLHPTGTRARAALVGPIALCTPHAAELEAGWPGATERTKR